LKDTKYGRVETDGLNALLTGLVAAQPDDLQNIEGQFEVYDALYAWCRLDVAKNES
jgi:hypothetical protein